MQRLQHAALPPAFSSLRRSLFSPPIRLSLSLFPFPSSMPSPWVRISDASTWPSAAYEQQPTTGSGACGRHGVPVGATGGPII